MNFLKNTFLLTYVFLIISCGETPKNQENQTKLNRLQQENDSLKKELTDGTNAIDSIIPIVNGEEIPPVNNETNAVKGAGKHLISLQWLGWEDLGTSYIKPTTNSWYSISGIQKYDEANYLTIEGKIKRISTRDLEFIGTIITKIKFNYGGKPCIKKGKQIFSAKGKRKYYRLQNMGNCEGDMLVDYVDIYPGNSEL